MSKGRVLNGVIESLHLGLEDHELWTAFVHTKHECGNQGFGGYCLYNKRHNVNTLGFFVKRVCETVGVRSWEELKGRPVRLKEHENGYLLAGIGAYIEDRWFFPEVELEAEYKRLLASPWGSLEG